MRQDRFIYAAGPRAGRLALPVNLLQLLEGDTTAQVGGTIKPARGSGKERRDASCVVCEVLSLIGGTSGFSPSSFWKTRSQTEVWRLPFSSSMLCRRPVPSIESECRAEVRPEIHFSLVQTFWCQRGRRTGLQERCPKPLWTQRASSRTTPAGS